MYQFIFEEPVEAQVTFENIKDELQRRNASDLWKRAAFVNMLNWSMQTRHYIAISCDTISYVDKGKANMLWR